MNCHILPYFILALAIAGCTLQMVHGFYPRQFDYHLRLNVISTSVSSSEDDGMYTLAAAFECSNFNQSWTFYKSMNIIQNGSHSYLTKRIPVRLQYTRKLHLLFSSQFNRPSINVNCVSLINRQSRIIKSFHFCPLGQSWNSTFTLNSHKSLALYPCRK